MQLIFVFILSLNGYSESSFQWLRSGKEIRARTRIPVEKCNFEWAIENFNFFICKVGEHLKSPTFSSGPSFQTTWNLTLYPNGRKKSESGKNWNLLEQDEQ
ncbi:TD and POZ domain-containing protein 4 [Caerostris extrusa]|uniref:TD and POZ domain-containing protein 4 n=1 Tax=Caerostris extrusa TaxID=172846 RepID=A0AAV4XBJ5_CAEEX|nr:TD and POZ domain-containing protein 4 [Caerostris extrusa]